jgi:hypothetical protein
MFKIVDFNAIASNTQPLETFFAASTENVAVLTDMMGIECLKRDGVANYRKSFEVFSKHSHRVLVLKEFPILRRLYPKKHGFLEAIVDQELTTTFPLYCQQMLGGSDSRIVTNIEAQQAKVQTLMGKIQKLVDEELRESISDVEKVIPAARLSQWRAGKPVSDDELKFVHGMIAGVTTGQFKLLFPNDPLPNAEDALYWLPFRYSVALQALTLKWIRDGGYLNAKAEKLRNDSIDIFYVAYGTIFNGVLTSDAKLLELSELAASILRYSYGLKRVA